MSIEDKILEAVMGTKLDDSMPTPVFVTKIIQAFKDEGWVKKEMHVKINNDLYIMNGQEPIIKIDTAKYLTGQEWNKRFQTELKKGYDSFVDFVDIDMSIYNHGKEAMMLAALEAANVASGIEKED